MEDRDTEAYLARIRKTVAESNGLLSQLELRMAETDRMLERQGLTREQVMAMRFTDAQIEAVNDELKRRGMSPLEKWEMGEQPPNHPTTEPPNHPTTTLPNYSATEPSSSDAELDNRQRKFGMMMKPFHI